jgi:hypothetical protein
MLQRVERYKNGFKKAIDHLAFLVLFSFFFDAFHGF